MKCLIAISVSSAIFGGLGIWNIISPPIPEWTSIRSEIAEGYTTTYNGKYAENYLDYLVDTKSEDNKKWWTWTFNTKYSLSFKSETGGFKAEFVKDGNTLSKACQAYESTKSEKIKEIEENLKKDEFKETDVWKYCSAEPQSKKKSKGHKRFF